MTPILDEDLRPGVFAEQVGVNSLRSQLTWGGISRDRVTASMPARRRADRAEIPPLSPQPCFIAKAAGTMRLNSYPPQCQAGMASQACCTARCACA
jgi:hypothetical protein